MKEIKAMTQAELKELIEAAKAELESRKPGYKFSLETIDQFDRRKHGHAYVARLIVKNGKLEREFVENNGLEWDGKRKYYHTTFNFWAREGDVFEARLDDGSWKRDYRDYYVVKGGELEKLEDGLTEAKKLLGA